MVEARERYEARWKALLDGRDELAFGDVPWPVMGSRTSIGVEDLTEKNISAFLLRKGTVKKERLRETMLRFHPDKFEGRFMGRVKAGEQEKVRDAVGRVVRVIHSLMHVPIHCKD
jgi:hypothetical protein